MASFMLPTLGILIKAFQIIRNARVAAGTHLKHDPALYELVLYEIFKGIVKIWELNNLEVDTEQSIIEHLDRLLHPPRQGRAFLSVRS